jgi:hypothetical protein
MVYPFLSLGLPNPGTLGVSSTGDLGGGDRSAFAIAVRLSLRPNGPTGKDFGGHLVFAAGLAGAGALCPV